MVDDANILSRRHQSPTSTGKLAALEAKTSRQLVVVTLPSLQGYEISDYGYQLGRAWGIGQAKLNNGVLLIVAPTEHKVRIEVGYGLEPILTDALSAVIIQTAGAAEIPQRRLSMAGSRPGVDALIQQLSLDTSDGRSQGRGGRTAGAAASNGQGGGGFRGLLIFLFIVLRHLPRLRRLGLAAVPVHGRRTRLWRRFGGGGWRRRWRRRIRRRRRQLRRRRRLGELVMLEPRSMTTSASPMPITAGGKQNLAARFSACWRMKCRAIAKCRWSGRRWRRCCCRRWLVLAGLHRLALADIFSSWTDDSVRAVEGLILRALTTYALVQAACSWRWR